MVLSGVGKQRRKPRREFTASTAESISCRAVCHDLLDFRARVLATLTVRLGLGNLVLNHIPFPLHRRTIFVVSFRETFELECGIATSLGPSRTERGVAIAAGLPSSGVRLLFNLHERIDSAHAR